ncbi:peroxiredoxin [Rickettsiales bacterium]|nr:peroxiredoxin [Rickettsiales bacterium]
MIKENGIIKNIILRINENLSLSIDELKGKKTIIYFYPKDDTPGCTKEAIQFNEFYEKFKEIGVKIYGVSKDSSLKHEKFKNKYSLKFDLITDDGTNCKDFGVWVEKSMYGKRYMGIERSTFFIDENLIVKKIWRKVKVPGHVEEVFNYIKNAI